MSTPRSKVVLIYGNTCAGKSTLGNLLHRHQGIPYTAFGDLKRQEISRSTDLGKRLEQAINAGKPIAPSDGMALLNALPVRDLQSLSGFPIALDELAAFVAVYTILGCIHLTLDDAATARRFLSRGTCPICNIPGVIGALCPEHQHPLQQRNDATEDELLRRSTLYRQRILPFLASLEQQGQYPLLTVNAEKHTAVELTNITARWISLQEKKI